MVIGERIKIARKAKGFSQQELGDLIGVSKVSICGYEKGTRTPTVNNLLDLIKVLDLDVSFVLGQDVTVVKEDSEEYQVKVATTDLEIIKLLKTHRELYNKICSNPKRMIDAINKKMGF